jgi:photosystem II stability/assembly factor-like uncharacterized protein
VGAWLGGNVFTIALSPTFSEDHLVLAATAAGLYRSVDGGLTWRANLNAPSDPALLGVAVVEQNRPGELRLFAASQSGRLFTSLDGGDQWSELAAWAGLGVITSFALSPVFAQDQTLFVTTQQGVYRSQDGGQRWESSTFGLHDLQTLCIVCAPDYASSEVVWVGTAQGGFYRSRNGGRSWRDSGRGLPDQAIQCVALSPRFAQDQTLLVGVENAGLFRSTDGGATWQPYGSALAGLSINSLAFSPQGNTWLAGTSNGLYYSQDGGEQWVAAIGGEFLAFSLVFGANGLALAGAHAEGIYRSTDGGRQWQPALTGLAAHAPPVVTSRFNGKLMALDSSGLLAYSPDQGESWQLLNPHGEPALFSALALTDDKREPHLFAISEKGKLFEQVGEINTTNWRMIHEEHPITFVLLAPSPTFAQDDTLALTDDQGRVHLLREQKSLWRRDVTPWSGEQLLQVACSPNAVETLILAAVTALRNDMGHYRLRLWRTTNRGERWEELATLHSETPSVAFAWPDEETILFATRHRIIKFFTPTAENELRVTQTLLPAELSITSLAVSPHYAHDQTLYAATTRGVYRSQDAGITWEIDGDGLQERVIVAVCPLPTDLCAVELGGVVWRLEGGD